MHPSSIPMPYISLTEFPRRLLRFNIFEKTGYSIIKKKKADLFYIDCNQIIL